MHFPRVASFKTADAFRQRLLDLELDLPLDDAILAAPESPLAQPYRSPEESRNPAAVTREGDLSRETAAGLRPLHVGNRFCILPMEGWDGTREGHPSDLTRRRWRNFGVSGAKLIWGGEAVAVRHDGRANPNQLVINDATLADIADLRDILLAAHRETTGETDDLLIGLQLTHSGRFSRPAGALAPRIVYRHPLLDSRFAVQSDAALFSDDEIARLIDDYIAAACRAYEGGYAFVDIKHCHGYLGHEFLSGVDRPGRYGGSFENRTRFLREIVAGIRAAVPGLDIGVRVSVFDFVPFQPGSDKVGVPMPFATPYHYAFGGDGSGLGIDLTEPSKFLDLIESLGIELVCTTVGSPYYNPHMQRPAAFPPSDGYLPPEDPLVGVARQIDATARLKAAHPRLAIVGSAYSYLQDWLPHVGQCVVRDGGADFVGLGRMALSYPELPADVLAGRPLDRKRICRTFSDCTTAPRNGIVSGCFPLDPFYKSRPEHTRLQELKRRE